MTVRVGVPFVGRSAELEALRGLLADVRIGHFGIAVVQGEAGIGKSRLIGEALAVAGSGAQEVFEGKCEEFEAERAFAPLCRAFGCNPGSPDPRRAFIRDLVTDLAAAQDLTNRHFRVIEEFIDLLEGAAVQTPTVLVVDDLQWADAATVTALQSFGKRLRHTSMAILVATRPVPTSLALRRLLGDWRDRGALLLPLDGLEGDEVKRLLTETFDAEPDEGALGFFRSASGNPLFLTELLGAIARDGLVTVSGGRATLTASSRPPSLDLIILDRLTFLSENSLRVLRFASLFGSAFLPSDLATIMATDLPMIVTSIEECIDARLLEEDRDRLRFRHDLIREVLYLDISEGIRAGLHRDAARALATSGAPLVLAARQYALGARPGDMEAVHAMRRAALEEGPSPAIRMELLQKAQALLKEQDPVWSELETDLIETMVWGGRPDEGQQRARALLDRVTDPALARRLRGAAAQALRLSARWVELAELLARWLADTEVDDRERIELLATDAYARGASVAFDARMAEQTGREALALAEREADEELIVHALIGLLPSLTRLGAVDARSLAERAVAIADAHEESRFHRDQPHWHLGLQLLADPDQAEGVFRAGLKVAERRGRLADLPLYLDGLAEVYFAREAWDEAMTEAEAAIASAEEVGTLLYVTGSHAISAHIRILRGELREAEPHIATEERLAELLGPQMEAVHLAHRAMVHELRGELSAAFDRRWDCFQIESTHGDEVNWFRCLFLSLHDDDRARAIAITDWLEARAHRTATERARAEARLARGMLERDAEQVRANLGAVGGTGMGMHHERAALAFASVGLPNEAIDSFQKCAAAYERVGAHPWVDQTARLLRGLAVPVPRRRRRARAKQGWEALTDAEWLVAELAAEGLTNPQIGERLFISRRTVQTHLAHIFDKLGIASRVELATEIARRADA